MNKKSVFNWPKEVYIFWLVDFLLGIELMGPILLIFFKEWGGLNQTEIQTLQSWFTLSIFILEIPTGVFGDTRGKKLSVMMGYSIMIIGVLMYSITPNIWLFFLSEFVFALAIAFISGAEQAWFYDISKNLGMENKFRKITVIGSNLHMLGMIIASLLFIPISKVLPVQHIFKLGVIPNLFALILLGLFLPATDGKKKQSLKPNYVKTFKKGFNLFKSNINLKKITIYLSILSATSYFVIWLYQEDLRVLGFSNEMFGLFRTVLLIGEIIMARVGAILLKRYSIRKVSILFAAIVGVGFIFSSILHNVVGILLLLILSGGLGLQIDRLFAQDLNEEISDDERATTLSFVSMVKRLMLTVFNPFIGFLVDSKGVFMAFLVLGLFSFLAIFSRPKFKLK